MALTPQQRRNFEILQDAFRRPQGVVLMECFRREDGHQVAVICTHAMDSATQDHTIIPFASLCENGVAEFSTVAPTQPPAAAPEPARPAAKKTRAKPASKTRAKRVPQR